MTLSPARAHTAPGSAAVARSLATSSSVALALPTNAAVALAHKCLLPVETPLSQDGELSARHAQHRSSDRFEALVHDTTWLLNHALGGNARHHHDGSSGRDAGETLGSDHVSRDSDAATSHTRTAAAGGGELYANAKTRRLVAAQAQRAYAFFRLHQFARAVHDYDACLAREPTAAVLYYNRGCALYAWGKKERAVHDFSRALKLDCKNVLFVESRAAVRKELGRFHEAIQDYTWLETLRQHRHHGGRECLDGQRRDSVVGPPSPEVMESASREPLATMRRSFSTTFSELQASLLGVRDAEAPMSSSTTEGTTTEERETHVVEAMVRFLQHSPRLRSPSDVADAVQHARHWSFFRAMDAAMVEQCLQDAAYAFYASDSIVVQQGELASHFRVVLNPTAPFVKNVDAQSGVSKLRELHKLSQGDAVGHDACAASGSDGTLRTIRHHELDARGSTWRSPSTETFGASALLPPEPASFTSLEPVHCMLLPLESYREILQEHEEKVLDDRAAFLRGCRVFQSCSDDVLTALAAASGARVYDPGKNLLKTGDEVTQLCVIRRGVCQVRKTLRVPPVQHEAIVPNQTKKQGRLAPLRRDDDESDPFAGDGSWVLDNGWMLTNPRLVTTPQPGAAKDKSLVAQDVSVGILASGQVFGELSVLQPGQPSQVTIHSQTLVEVLVLAQRDLAMLRIQYHSGPMNALQESLLFHNPPQQKIVQLQRDRAAWDRHKRSVLRELALQLPTKAQSVLRTAAGMAQSPLRRRASLVSMPPLVRHRPMG